MPLDNPRCRSCDGFRNEKMRALVVEDDALLAEGLTSVLSRAGHTVVRATTGNEANVLLANDEFGFVVLDIGLPDIDGFEVLRRLRERRLPSSVLVLTARNAVDDRVRGLDLGADDYLTKPFSVKEFEARVRAMLRRGVAAATPWRIAGMTVDVAAKRVRVGERTIELTPREWALLELFLTHPGRVISKEHIAESIFTFDDQLSPNAIEVYVSRLRTKVEPVAARLRTVRGFGYLWDVEDE
jgi:two-component system, OmpR family, response regulator